MQAAGPAIDRLSDLSDVIVLGTGGSSLGGATLYRLVDPVSRGEAIPQSISSTTSTRSPSTSSWRASSPRTGLVSKSGGTAETLCQTAIVVAWMKAAGGASGVAARSLFITEPKPSPMTSIASALGAEVLPHDSGVGGRYSVLTITGLVPAAIAGVDVAGVRPEPPNSSRRPSMSRAPPKAPLAWVRF